MDAMCGDSMTAVQRRRSTGAAGRHRIVVVEDLAPVIRLGARGADVNDRCSSKARPGIGGGQASGREHRQEATSRSRWVVHVELSRTPFSEKREVQISR